MKLWLFEQMCLKQTLLWLCWHEMLMWAKLITRTSFKVSCQCHFVNGCLPDIKLQPYGTPRRLRDQVTFRAAFIAVTAALQRERARAWSPLQSAWRTHRKSTLAGRPGAKDRALSTRMSEAQTEREAVAERGQGQANAVSFKSWLHLFLQWHHTYRWIITHSNPALQITFWHILPSL